MLGAAPAYADKIDDAAKVLSEKSYPFLQEIDWTSDVYAKLPTQNALDVLKAINTMLKMGASMDPAALKTGVLAHSQAIANMDSKGVATLADYTAINAAIAPAYADKIDDAAKVLSEKSYPFLKEIDWTSDVYGKLPTQNALDVLKAIDPHFEGKPCNAIDTMLKMGASMDPAALKTGVLAHSKAIANMDSKGVATLAVNAGDAKAAYQALMDFKDVVKASQR
ncbi:unnamed protein product [Symbiodinium sp. KB8]|nr:unnamed protein product [Symbiodinium sp. KB8]